MTPFHWPGRRNRIKRITLLPSRGNFRKQTCDAIPLGRYGLMHTFCGYNSKRAFFSCDTILLRVRYRKLQFYLSFSHALSFTGGHQKRLRENGGDRSRWGCFLLEYARTQSIVAVMWRFRTKFGNDPPASNSIKLWHENFQFDRWLCIATHPWRPGPSEEAAERVRQAFQHSPQKVTHRASRELVIPQPTLWWILLKLLWLQSNSHPFSHTNVQMSRNVSGSYG
jgi:hypothetical protein